MGSSIGRVSAASRQRAGQPSRGGPAKAIGRVATAAGRVGLAGRAGGASLALLLILFATSPVTAQYARGGSFDEERKLETVVRVRVLGREIVVLDGEGGDVLKLRLESGERVLWYGSSGRIGLVLTDRRGLGVRSGGGWRELRLRIRQTLLPRAELGDRIGLLVTSTRLLAFDGNWSRAELGPNEQLHTALVGSGTALAVTDRRALALSAGSSGFLEVPLQLHERVEETYAGAALAEVTTSRRVLSFSSRFGNWSEELRTLR